MTIYHFVQQRYVRRQKMTVKTVQNKSVQNYRSFWGQWTLASAAGFAIGAMLSLPIAYGLGEIVMDATNETIGFAITGALFGIFAGGGLGLGQQIVLRFSTGWGRNWALVSALAAAIVWAIAFPVIIAADQPMRSLNGVAIVVSFGLALGIGQWLVLRNHLPQASRWVLATSASLALALGASLALDGEGRELLAFAVGGLLVGALTGLGMVWMLRDSASAD
jgi:hypothetical protein